MTGENKALKIDGEFDPGVQDLIDKHSAIAFAKGREQGIKTVGEWLITTTTTWRDVMRDGRPMLIFTLDQDSALAAREALCEGRMP